MPLRGREISDLAARASFAAGKQGKFWEFHDEAFSAKDLSKKSLDTIAAKLGLNAPDVQQRFAKDAKEAQDAGVRGTPTVFINGQRLKNRSLKGFQALIDKELSKLK